MICENGERIESKLENIENLLKMLLVDNILAKDRVKQLEDDMVEELSKLLSPYSMSNVRLNMIEDQYYVFADMDPTVSMAMLKKYYQKASEALKENKLVLSFEKLHVKRKESLHANKISYYVLNKEMHIF